MLTLTRKRGEAFVVFVGEGEQQERITVVVKEIRRGRIRLGILAPPRS
jgi:sRNA-binding carbon storage regulator CsrA